MAGNGVSENEIKRIYNAYSPIVEVQEEKKTIKVHHLTLSQAKEKFAPKITKKTREEIEAANKAYVARKEIKEISNG